jgi:hypothetical protein
VADIALTEKSTLKLTISSWYHVLAIIGTIVALYFGIRTDVQAAIQMGVANASEIKNEQESIVQVRMDVRRVSDNIDWFRQQYERDMTKYIREPGTK